LLIYLLKTALRRDHEIYAPSFTAKLAHPASSAPAVPAGNA